MTEKPRYTFHLTPEEYFNSFELGVDYTPPSFAEEGFIHCTDGAENMARTANRHYLSDPRTFLMLVIDKTAVRAPIRYEDPEEIYAHIYGPLNLDAVVAVRPALRAGDGTFFPPSDANR